MKLILNLLVLLGVVLVTSCALTPQQALPVPIVQQLSEAGCEIHAYRAVGLHGSVEIKCKD